MTGVSKRKIGRGAAYIYIETIASLISGYAFWIVMSKISPTDIIGISSAVVSLAGIFTVVSTIGVPSGILRFLGKSFGEQNMDAVIVFFKASLLMVCLGTIGCAIIILLLRDWMYTVFPIDFSLLIVAIVIISSSVIAQFFRSVLVSSLKTKSLPGILLISSIAKIILGVALVLLGTGALGLTIGYASYQILTSILLGIIIAKSTFVSVKNQDKSEPHPGVNYRKATRSVFDASVVYWIPFLITTVGSQLGPLVVLGYEGSSQAGIYFIALTIVVGITNVMYSLFTIAIPALSAMKDGRKRLSWQAIRLSAIIVLPFSYALIFFSDEILQLLGQDYSNGALSLQILLISLLPTTVIYGIHSLSYAYGNYRQVLAIGLATSIPRTVLYFVLVPEYGGIGAAVGYTVGAITGLFLSAAVAKKIGVKLNWGHLLLTVIVPAGLAFVLDIIQTNYIVAIIGTIAVSYLILYKIHIILRSDIVYLLDILPGAIARPLIGILRKVEDRIGRYY
jgi:O-antigen/teichoic acid export membrane protein